MNVLIFTQEWAGGALACISRLKARQRLGVSEIQLLSAEA